MKFLIRKIQADDVKSVVNLLHEFADYENLRDYCTITEEKLRTAILGETAVAEGMIALDNGEPAGYAIFYPSFSSFRGERSMHLEDIYISERYRGNGLGLTMLKEIARIAASRGYERIDFMVLDWNLPAINFYKKLGAQSNDDETHFKFIGKSFVDLTS